MEHEKQISLKRWRELQERERAYHQMKQHRLLVPYDDDTTESVEKLSLQFELDRAKAMYMREFDLSTLKLDGVYRI